MLLVCLKRLNSLGCAQDKPEAAQKFSAKASLISEKQSQRRIGHKSANEFIRSSQAQQEDRRQRMKKQAQKYAKKLAATQKTSKPGRRRKPKKKPEAEQTQPQSQNDVAEAQN